MILAAGLGTRLQPLSKLRPKPAMPVRGLPVIGYVLRLLQHHGVTEAIVNLHHRADELAATLERCRPAGMTVHLSREEVLLGTGGGIRRAADFLRASDPALVLSGDMLLDTDLGALVALHRERRDLATLLLVDDRARAGLFGTIGVDEDERVRRISKRFDLGGEKAAGVFVGVRVLSSRAFETLPDDEAFEDLTDWFAPMLSSGARDIRAHRESTSACLWEPVGTLEEYLRVNLHQLPFSFLEPDQVASEFGTQLQGSVILGAGARIASGARLRRTVVWEGETVPAGFTASDGVFAGGQFHACASEKAMK
ncbi:MAG: sugar phosphate nucleotidyltransferase [Myxococcota bacterium]